MRKIGFLLVMTTLFCTYAQAQGWSYGFRAGMNFSTFVGDKETDASSGDELEAFSINSGFHIGVGATYTFTDIYGIRGEIMYSQKGTQDEFDGPSYLLLPTEGGEQLIATGNRRQFLDITNTYLDIPIVGVANVGRFEFVAGFNVGILLSSSASGDITFTDGMVQTGNELESIPSPLNISLNYDFFGDEEGEANLNEDPYQFMVAGENISLPREFGAYYSFTDEQENLFNTFDFGLLAGVSYYFNDALFLGARANLGLTDVTESRGDRSLNEINEDGSLVSRDDRDRNLMIQASIGFSF